MKDEWKGIYRDSKDYADCFGVENGVWEVAEAQSSANGNAAQARLLCPADT